MPAVRGVLFSSSYFIRNYDRPGGHVMGDLTTTTSPKKRGFAAMDAKKQREIASRGGQAAHKKGTAHQFNSREAQIAGRKGGRAVSQDRRHMAEIGRKGGEAGGTQTQSAPSQERQNISSKAGNKNQLVAAGRR